MNYKTEDDVLALVEKFEDGTISRDAWGHPEHLVVAFYYVSHNDFETALAKMRGGIFNLLRAFGVDLSKEMPYHETMTVFWIRTVYDFAKSANGHSLESKIGEMIEKFDKNYPLKFYTRELLFSDEARERFVEGDLPVSWPVDADEKTGA